MILNVFKIVLMILTGLFSFNTFALETVTMQLRWTHQFQFAGYYAAIEKGFYEEAGLTVLLQEGSPDKMPVNEVLQGRAEYGEANSELLWMRLRGEPLIALAAIFQHSPSVLLLRKEVGAPIPTNLIGKRVMMMNKTFDTDFFAMFNQEGIDENRLTIVPSSFDVQDFIDAKVDAFNAYVTDEPYLLKSKGVDFSILNPSNYGIDFYSDILFTSENELKNHPARVKAFREATLRGWIYAMENPQEIIDVIINKYHVSKSRHHLEFEARTMPPLITPDLIEIGHMNPWRWKHMTEIFVNAGMVDKEDAEFYLNDFMYEPDIKLDKGQFERYINVGTLIIILGFVIILILVVAYKSIRRENQERKMIAKILEQQTNELALHNRILKRITSSDVDLKTALHELIKEIEIQNSEMLCSILLLDETEKCLRVVAAPSLPEFYNKAIDKMEIGQFMGSCGSAVFTGETVIVGDIQSHPNWKNFRDLAARANLAACWSQPIKNKRGEILGTFAIYHKTPIKQPLINEVELIEQYASLVVLMIERYQDDNKIKQLAFYDPLTNLPNRRLLLERIKHNLEIGKREKKRMALLMLDLDRFKWVNDSFGHLAGDELLQQVAQRIKSRLRDMDTVARLGGDEFTVLLEDITHVDDAARVAESIVNDLSRPFSLTQNDHVQIGTSIGISLYPEHGKTAEALIDNADTALYHAKDSGRGCFAYFSDELTCEVRKRIELETRLRQAIAHNELCVYYQPQVDIDTGKIVGAESLVRWQDAEAGFLVPPSQFIPIAEETGLIEHIGEWVLRETCRQGKGWLDKGIFPITLAVNVSPHQFRRGHLIETVSEVLEETHFPAHLLELELTESGLMENHQQTISTLNALRAKGVRLSIDDFGTGYSSLAYLKHFPLDVLKIDKSFVDDIPKVKEDMAIISTIIAMGQILGFKVLAEGVENFEQLKFLQEKGCDAYQGYIKSKPLSAEEFEVLLLEHQHFSML